MWGGGRRGLLAMEMEEKGVRGVAEGVRGCLGGWGGGLRTSPGKFPCGQNSRQARHKSKAPTVHYIKGSWLPRSKLRWGKSRDSYHRTARESYSRNSNH